MICQLLSGRELCQPPTFRAWRPLSPSSSSRTLPQRHLWLRHSSPYLFAKGPRSPCTTTTARPHRRPRFQGFNRWRAFLVCQTLTTSGQARWAPNMVARLCCMHPFSHMQPLSLETLPSCRASAPLLHMPMLSALPHRTLHPFAPPLHPTVDLLRVISLARRTMLPACHPRSWPLLHTPTGSGSNSSSSSCLA